MKCRFTYRSRNDDLYVSKSNETKKTDINIFHSRVLVDNYIRRGLEISSSFYSSERVHTNSPTPGWRIFLWSHSIEFWIWKSIWNQRLVLVVTLVRNTGTNVRTPLRFDNFNFRSGIVGEKYHHPITRQIDLVMCGKLESKVLITFDWVAITMQRNATLLCTLLFSDDFSALSRDQGLHWDR